MNKEKLKHIPINLLLSLPTFFVVYSILSFIPGLNDILIGFVSITFYMVDAKQGSQNDYFGAKIKELEKKVKDLEDKHEDFNGF